MSDRFVIKRGEIFSRSSVVYDSKTGKEYVVSVIGIGEGNDYYETTVINVNNFVEILNDITK